MQIKVLIWLTFQDKLPTGVVLKRRNWKRDGRCVVCKVPESSDRIFLLCLVRAKRYNGTESLLRCGSC